MTIRSAVIGDAAQLVTAVRESFTSEELQLFVYGYNGIEPYVRHELLLPPHLSAGVYLVAEEHGSVVGCAQFRSSDSSLFLSYICVAPPYRGRGIGAALLADGIARFGNGAASLSLDVFQSNVRAQVWYSQLGLARIAQSDYLAVTPLAPSEHHFRIDGWTQAEVSHEAFTFSTFTVTTDLGCYSVGRLGSRWFRITDARALADPGLLWALSRVEPARQILAIVHPSAVSTAADIETCLLASTVRLSGPIRTVHARLLETE